MNDPLRLSNSRMPCWISWRCSRQHTTDLSKLFDMIVACDVHVLQAKTVCMGGLRQDGSGRIVRSEVLSALDVSSSSSEFKTRCQCILRTFAVMLAVIGNSGQKRETLRKVKERERE